ncbi:MAG: fimbrillin family protein [Prevotella sp.]|jgi:hypothetical protein|nr:fimbrillin family protein [Prevotella sp.]
MISKKRRFVFRSLPGLFLSGLLLLSGCSQDDVSGVTAGSRAIGFRAQGGMSSLKSTTTGTSSIQSFVVSAHYNKVDWSAGNYLLCGATVYREGDRNPLDPASWTYSPQAYFPTENATIAGDTYVEFMAYSPSVSSYVTSGLKDAATGGDGNQTITYTVPAPSATGVSTQEDFLVAYQKVDAAESGSAYSGTVALQFRHALSRVLVAAGSSLTEPVTITGLALRNLHTTGTLKMKGGIGTAVTWDQPDASDPVGHYPYHLPVSGVSVGKYVKDKTPDKITGYEQGMFVLPQLTRGTLGVAHPDTVREFYLEVKYSINGSEAVTSVQFGDLVAPASGAGVTFEAGKQYVLNLTFGAGASDPSDPDSKPTVDIGASISFGDLQDVPNYETITVPMFNPKPVIWSQSNIYFDAASDGDADPDTGILTFEESAQDKQFYQGVYFKWGSLIGVSAGTDDTSFENSYLFIPDLSTGAYHKIAVSTLGGYSGSVTAVNDFKVALGGLGVSWASYDDIWVKLPHVKQDDIDVPINIPGLSGASYVDDNGLTVASNNDLYDTYRGDICRYLASKRTVSGNDDLTKETWRMPTSREFGVGGANTNTVEGADFEIPDSDYNTKWNSTDYSAGSFANGFSVDGTGELTTSGNWYHTLVRWVFDANYPSFPAAGLRYSYNGSLHAVGDNGPYWSSSVAEEDKAAVVDMGFARNHVGPNGYPSRGNGQSVRCVRAGE